MIEEIIRNRRTIKTAAMNGNIIAEETINTMLEMADWAPTHGKTEPWRFIVLNNEKARTFSHQHAELYKANTTEEKFLQATYDKLFQQSDKASHLVIVYAHTGDNPKIKLGEELAAVHCAIQNMLLFATAKNIAGFWSTGGLTYHPALKNHLRLGENEFLTGLLFFGYAEEISKKSARRIPLSEKTKWDIL
jgi:nitroreductase